MSTIDGQTERDPLSIKIKELEFSVRATSSLHNAGVLTLRDLVSMTKPELMAVPNFGNRTMREVKEMLAGFGLHLRGTGIPAPEDMLFSALAKARAAKKAYDDAVAEVQKWAKVLVDNPMGANHD